MENKITKKEIFETIKEYLETGHCKLDTSVIVEFCDKEINALDTKSAKAKERAAAKRAEADELLEQVQNVLTDEYQAIADITAAVNLVNADATVHKVTNRLTRLVDSGIAEKTEISVAGVDGGKARKIKAFKICNADA